MLGGRGKRKRGREGGHCERIVVRGKRKKKGRESVIVRREREEKKIEKE